MDKLISIINENNINNEELLKLIKYIKEEPVFISDNIRLLSIEEILNYKEELKIDKLIIPLIDLYDNNFLVFDIEKKEFQMLDISDEQFWKKVDSIEKYLNMLENM